MHILLINTNPVLSRLLALCTRDDSFILEEVSNVREIEKEHYNVVFVDEASCTEEVVHLLTRWEHILKVYISYEDVLKSGFDVNIKKPFLPSQIIALIEEAKENAEKEVEDKSFIFPLATEVSDTQSTEEKKNETIEKSLIEEATQLLEINESEDNSDAITKTMFEEEVQEERDEEDSLEISLESTDEVLDNQPLSVLNGDEIAKIKALLEMDEDLELLEEEPLSAEEIELRKREVITEQLIAEGLEIVEEKKILDEIVEELSSHVAGTLAKKKKKKKKSKKLKFTEEAMEAIEDAVQMAMASMTQKQMKKLLKGKKVDITVQIEGQK